jgi:cob(I)alamin adenosyltransferase
MVHVYTGDGKGKTTAAIGLAIRAIGAGFKVLMVFGLGHFIKGVPSAEDFNAAQIGIEETESIVRSGKYNMVILDEANVAVKLGLFSVDDLLYIINNKPDNVELIITGRDAEQKLIEKADLVTEMKEIKHYFRKGIVARVGIEK